MKYELVYLEWEDAVADSGWKTSTEVREWARKQSGLVKECGWIIEENKEWLIMASRIGPIKSNNEPLEESDVGLVQKIPRTWIRKRKKLKI